MDAAVYSAVISAAFPTVAVLVGILLNNSRLNDMSARISDVYARIGDTHARIDETNARITALREELSAVFMANLRRVEEVIDARLTHIEQELDRRR